MLLGISALSVAACAAYFSIHGIILLFSGSMLAVGIMASTLEIAKLITTSYLYRYWEITNLALKIYLLVAILILMGITSAGIYGFLSSAYQKSSSGFQRYNNQIQLIENQKNFENKKIEFDKKRIDDLSELNKQLQEANNEAVSKFGKDTNSTNIRRTIDLNLQQMKDNNDIIKELQKNQSEYIKNIQKLDDDISKIKEDLSKLGDIQTFNFIAKAIGTDLNTIVKWFILILVIVFDPLAVGLVLAFNIATVGKIIKDSHLNDGEKNVNSIKKEDKEFANELLNIIKNIDEKCENNNVNQILNDEKELNNKELNDKDVLLENIPIEDLKKK